MPILEAKSLQKIFRLGEHSVHALAGVDFAVEKGEFVALMGRSGSGKSTLLHLIGGLDRPSEGEVTLAGMQLSLLDDDKVTLVRRRNIGFIFQFFNLLPTLTTEENIALPLTIDGKDIAGYKEQIATLLNHVGLEGRRTHKPDQLSGGEQQRVAIARALVTQPSIVLADEPTGNLDSKNSAAIMELLRRSCDELKQTIIVVTHDPRAAAYADRAVFLRDGKIAKELKFNKKQKVDQRLSAILKTMEDLPGQV
ncbi:MAG: putative ABC transporter ATP-binding protein [Anaerolineales bacterium]|nr:putative ABC transporter ATP-binding protein [Anaerolineales bacterium]WKZ49267.1 MAG: ABC transporter ATP-binding protein [Anaerolineales bacterium]